MRKDSLLQYVRVHDSSKCRPKLLNVKTPVVDDSKTTHGRDLGNDEDVKESRTATNRVNATKPDADHKDEYQIRLDTDRSFVLYPEGKPSFRTVLCHALQLGSRSESEPGINKDRLKADLNHLIVSVFRNRPKLNYFQGYHDIMTVIYLTLPQELQLACAEKLSLQRLRDSMLPSLEPVLGLLRYVNRTFCLYQSNSSWIQCPEDPITPCRPRIRKASWTVLFDFISAQCLLTFIHHQRLSASILRPLKPPNTFLARHANSVSNPTRL